MLKCIIDWVFPPPTWCNFSSPFITPPNLTLLLGCIVVVLLLCQAFYCVHLRNQFREIVELITTPKKTCEGDDLKENGPDIIDIQKKLSRIETLLGDLRTLNNAKEKKLEQVETLLGNLADKVKHITHSSKRRSSRFQRIRKAVIKQWIKRDERKSIKNSEIPLSDTADCSNEQKSNYKHNLDNILVRTLKKRNYSKNSKCENVLASLLTRYSPKRAYYMVHQHIKRKYSQNVPFPESKHNRSRLITSFQNRKWGYLERSYFIALLHDCLTRNLKRKRTTKKVHSKLNKKKLNNLAYIRSLRRYYSDTFDTCQMDFKLISLVVEKKCQKRLKERVVKFFKEHLIEPKILFYKMKELYDKSLAEPKVLYRKKMGYVMLSNCEGDFNEETTPKVKCCSENLLQNLNSLQSKVSSYLNKKPTEPNKEYTDQLIDDLVPRAKALEEAPMFEIPRRGISFKPQLLSANSRESLLMGKSQSDSVLEVRAKKTRGVRGLAVKSLSQNKFIND